jgi:photosystem II stability/assembly factor-like uncharacterized protein
MPLGCSSEEDDDPVPPPAAFGPSLIAVGDNGNILTSGDATSWTLVTPPAGMAALDLLEVVRIPNHASRRLVTYGRDDAAGTNRSQIWYSDDGGTTWLQGTITVALPAYPAGSGYRINDMAFVNELDGYAIGDSNLMLRTVDAGLTWTEMNTFWAAPGAVGTCVEINIGTVTGTDPVQGTLVTQATTPVSTGNVVSYDDLNDYVVIEVVSGAFDNTAGLTWTGGSGTVTGWVSGGVAAANVWKYRFETPNCLYAVQNTGTGPTYGHTIWFANNTGENYEGIWKIVGTAAAAGAARTFTWTTPTVAFQAGALIGDVSYDDIYRFFFFDQNTGVAAREDYGMLTTIDGGATWTHPAVTEINSYNEYWSEFWYVNNGATGWLYSVENDGYVARVGIDYSAAGTPPYTFQATGGVWAILQQTNNNSAEVDDTTGAVLNSNHAFVIAVDSTGDWTYGDTLGSTLLTDDVFSDPNDLYRGGLLANGDNPAYNKEIEVGVTSYYLNHWCER